MGKNPSQLASLARKQAEKRQEKKDLHADFRRSIVHDQHGAPTTAKVIHVLPNRPDLKERIISYGHVILVDGHTGEFIASIFTLHNNHNNNQNLRDQFDWATKLLYHHGLARNKCTINKAAEALGQAKSGEMYPIGSRGGTDKGKSAGAYVLNTNTRSDPHLIMQDIQRMKLLPTIDKFISKLFANLVFSQFKANLVLRQQYGVYWASPKVLNTSSKSSVGSNLVITRDEFANELHEDPDASGCAIGLFCLMERDSGNVIYPNDSDTPPPFHIEGAYFHLDKYNTKIRLSHLPKVVIWNTKTLHHSSHSQTLNVFGERVTPEDANLTNFGSSVQISKTIVDRIKGMNKKEAGMSDKMKETFKKEHIKDYAEEITSRLTELKTAKKLDPLIEAQIKAGLKSLE
ncbi:uncharacterized protein MELLADRAFT_102217 [Melampsora larici-populina 98AG31]|uniref:Tet-like 2OG-Fe(II) oxygenase domain-containing protein n=1 Tax=Melampsora larici-populina (strain 98AG31 / pathotype 3-4-7) TaxID=747676 RepID=F4R7K3_MELLP|nr:uncharacterized protein MELLADRAFT_102217 [Melampsora larici-populina 98AG31]EGG11769.1 hypothetical protein MELLADRAFT_102217 [Melampsora larici-populina 98AG31]